MDLTKTSLKYIIIMQVSAETIRRELQGKWDELMQRRKEADEVYARARGEKDAAVAEVKAEELSFLEDLQDIRVNFSLKISLINRAHDHFTHQYDVLQQRRKQQPPRIFKPPRQKIDNLTMQMANLLKFDCLSKKKARMEAEYQLRCNRVKDEIKKVKLKISLTELEINEAQKKSAKKSVKFSRD